ncbi:hypothetical protein DL96DRAFT_1821841 [Flagelloscypha sp. PMI_526]|nr:hypothetical protein DL96DRAFT_1821841 [Flagelloscypha sp. PMI_526]
MLLSKWAAAGILSASVAAPAFATPVVPRLNRAPTATVDEFLKAVSSGPPIGVDKRWGAPTITNDGVSVSKEIDVENHMNNVGPEFIKEVTTKINIEGGETTANTLVKKTAGESRHNVANI